MSINKNIVRSLQVSNTQFARQLSSINHIKLILKKYKQLLRNTIKRANIMGQAVGQTSRDSWIKLQAETATQIQCFNYQVDPLIIGLQSLNYIDSETQNNLKIQSHRLYKRFKRFESSVESFRHQIPDFSIEYCPILRHNVKKYKNKVWAHIDIDDLPEEIEVEAILYPDEKASQLRDFAKETYERFYKFISQLRQGVNDQ